MTPENETPRPTAVVDSRRGGPGPPPDHVATGRTPAQAAAVQCSVDYTTNDWGSGFTAELTVTNRGSAAIDGWTLTYDYAGNQKLSNGWNGTWSQSGKTVTVRNASWNGAIAAGRAVTTGAQFTYSGTNTAPTSFAVNGTACAGAHQPPITVLTSPAAGAVFSAGRRRPAGRHRRGRRWRDDQQGRVLRRHEAARHGHHLALHVLGRRPDRGRPLRATRRRTTAWAPRRSPRRSASPSSRVRPSSPPAQLGVQQGKSGDLRRQALHGAGLERDGGDGTRAGNSGLSGHRRRESSPSPRRTGTPPSR